MYEGGKKNDGRLMVMEMRAHLSLRVATPVQLKKAHTINNIFIINKALLLCERKQKLTFASLGFSFCASRIQRMNHFRSKCATTLLFELTHFNGYGRTLERKDERADK